MCLCIDMCVCVHVDGETVGHTHFPHIVENTNNNTFHIVSWAALLKLIGNVYCFKHSHLI